MCNCCETQRHFKSGSCQDWARWQFTSQSDARLTSVGGCKSRCCNMQSSSYLYFYIFLEHCLDFLPLFLYFFWRVFMQLAVIGGICGHVWSVCVFRCLQNQNLKILKINARRLNNPSWNTPGCRGNQWDYVSILDCCTASVIINEPCNTQLEHNWIWVCARWKKHVH